MHEPFAPSTASVALRHSRALNVGTFHAPAERVISTQVARRFVERFFGRLDARTASFEATRELMERAFPATYEVLRAGAGTPERAPAGDALRIAFIDHEDRQALRLFLRALRRLPDDVAWRATVFTPVGARTSALRSRLRGRVDVVTAAETTEEQVLAGADVVVAASVGQAPAPGLLVRALGAGAVPIAARLQVYEEVLREGELGLLFEPADAETLAAQLTRLLTDDALRGRLAQAVAATAPELAWSGVAERFEALYEGVAARRHPPRADGDVRARLSARKLIDVDLHMHTDHSNDCATPVDLLLATARAEGLGAIAITDHNEVSGALDARAKAEEYGVKVIVAEEVKTATQGEVIGLFIEEKIRRGMSLEETIAEIKRQGGLVYVPHPFDRMHSVPDYEHLLAVVEDVDAIEVFNPRIAIPAYNEEAVRFARQVPDRRRRRLGLPCRAGPRLGADPHARLRRPGRVPRLARRRRHRRPAVLALLRPGAGAEVPPDAGDAAGRAARRPAPADPPGDLGAQSLMQGQGEPGGTAKPVGAMPATDDEIREKYLERAIRELNHFTRDLQACSACPRGSLMPILGSGHPQADMLPAQVRADRVGDRGGRRVLRALGDGADEVAPAARDRPARGLRDAVRQVPGAGHRDGGARVRGAASRGDRDRAAADRGDHGAGRARDAERPGAPARPAGRPAQRRDPAADALDRRALRPEHRRRARRGVRQARLLDRVQAPRRLVRRLSALLKCSAGHPDGVLIGKPDIHVRA